MTSQPRRILFTGHRTFANRGCEAIVRSTVAALKEVLGPTEFLVPSDNIPADSRQWPEASTLGVHFVPVWSPWYTRFWVHLQRLPLTFLKRAAWPFPMGQQIRDMVASVDAVFSIGGDNYSLDYRIPSPLVALDAFALSPAKPVILWGASVGPFEREPSFVPTIRAHLSRFSAIFVRETWSLEYTRNTLGLTNVSLMSDPAFTLLPEAVGPAPFWPTPAPNGVLGLNVSPLIERYKRNGQDIRAEVAQFIREVVKVHQMGVLLIPHVIPHDQSPKGSDHYYMRRLVNQLTDLGTSARLAPPNLNAAQLKHVISKLRFFIGARTHATIAALSSCVPTISIAYSVKARGINRDIFGHEHTVLPTPSVSAECLLKHLSFLSASEDDIRARLANLEAESAHVIHDCLSRLAEGVLTPLRSPSVVLNAPPGAELAK